MGGDVRRLLSNKAMETSDACKQTGAGCIRYRVGSQCCRGFCTGNYGECRCTQEGDTCWNKVGMPSMCCTGLECDYSSVLWGTCKDPKEAGASALLQQKKQKG